MNDTAGDSPTEAGRRHPRRMLAVLITPLFMALVSVSVINVALPSIQSGLRTDSTHLQWVISGYALSFGMLLIPAGRAGDARGRRRLFLVGLSLFVIGSALSALAPTILVLNVARVLQGIGSGLLNPQTIGMIHRTFSGQDRAMAFALMGTTVGVSTAIGPVLGGVLIGALGPELGWRWIFGMNVPIGLVALVGAMRWLPQDRLPRGARSPDLDPVGALLLGATVLGIMLPFLERGTHGLIWGTPVLALGLAYAWVRWEKRYARSGREPMVRVEIFRQKAFTAGLALISVHFVGITSVWISVAVFVQMGLGASALVSGLIGLPASVLNAITAQIAGRHVLRLRRLVVVIGFCLAITGLLGTIAVLGPVADGTLPIWAVAIPLALLGPAQGCIVSPNQTLTLEQIDVRYGGVAGGILQTGQRLGGATGTALIPGILFQLVETGHAWTTAMTVALLLIAGLATIALVIAVADHRRERRAPD